jgi:hypothetical protein
MLTRKRLCATAFQLLPVRTVDLHVSPDFSVVYWCICNGLVSERRLTDAEMILTLDGFIELARKFGWTVTPSSGN